jgi:dynamin 1-like protein
VPSQVSPDARLDLPQVAVVGAQSSGKSSVLEALVGRDFLPRGASIVTRRPLLLQLVRAAPGEPEWAEFLHRAGQRFTDFERVRQEILAETERGAGADRGVSDRPIRLRVFSPHVLTMTLVDLPGLARVPVGDQPPDIEARLRRLILHYASNPACIILAVTPANQDLASSDALDLARQADPEGRRTIGVLTKLDIMDRGTDAAAALRGEVVPLRLGYVGVVLRSQEDVAARRPVAVARAAEAAFFAGRAEYAGVRGRCGVATLARALNGRLAEAIAEALPALRGRLEGAAAARARELRALGDAPPGASSAQRGAALLAVLDAYAARFAAALDGLGEHLPLGELAGGARIRHIFQDVFAAGLDALAPTADLSDADVRTAIRNSGGVKGCLLIPEAPFELLVRRAIERLLPPALQCKEFVHGELLRVAAQALPPDAARFPALAAVLAAAAEELVGAGAAPAEAMIRDLVACELAYINTSHPDFVGGNRAIAQVLERRGAGGGAAGSGAGGAAVAFAAATRAPAANNHTAGLAAAAKLPPRSVEPELFCAEELLAARRGAAAAAAASPAQPPAPDAGGGEQQHQHGGGPGAWLAGLFGRGGPDGGAAGAAGPPSPAPLLCAPPETLRVPDAATDQEGVQVEVTRVLVDSYYGIVRRNLQDAVPKALMNFLVGASRRGLQAHLIRSLYREELFGALMEEAADAAARRAAAHEALRALRAALRTLDALPMEMAGRAGGGGAAAAEAAAARAGYRQLLAAPRRGEDGGGAREGSPARRERDAKARAGGVAAAHKALAAAAGPLGRAAEAIPAYRTESRMG